MEWLRAGRQEGEEEPSPDSRPWYWVFAYELGNPHSKGERSLSLATQDLEEARRKRDEISAQDFCGAGIEVWEHAPKKRGES